jgi:hypothetical protein
MGPVGTVDKPGESLVEEAYPRPVGSRGCRGGLSCPQGGGVPPASSFFRAMLAEEVDNVGAAILQCPG